MLADLTDDLLTNQEAVLDKNPKILSELIRSVAKIMDMEEERT